MANPTNFNVYRYDDEDAPVIYNPTTSVSTALQITNVLDKVLVSGYGSKTPAGWTKPYEAGSYHVYKMGANSSGRYLQVYANPVLTSYSPTIRTEIFDSMTSATEGTGSIYGPLYPRSTPGWGVLTSGTSVKMPWVIVANSATCYFLRAKYYGGITSLGVVGAADIISYDGVSRTLLVNEYLNEIGREVDEGLNVIDIFSNGGIINGGAYLTGSMGHDPVYTAMSNTNHFSHNYSGRVGLITTEYFTVAAYGGGTWSVNMGDNARGTTVLVEPIYVVGYYNKTPTLYGKLPGIFRARVPLRWNFDISVRNNFLICPAYRPSYATNGAAAAIDITGDWYGGS